MMEFIGRSLDSSAVSPTRKLDKLLLDCTDLENKTLKDLEKVIYYENLNLRTWRRIKSDLNIEYDDTFNQAEYLKGQAAIKRLIYGRYIQDLENNQKITEILESTISPKSSINSNVFKFDNLSNIHMLKQFSKHKRKFGEIWRPVSKPCHALSTDASPKSCKNGSNSPAKHLRTESCGTTRFPQQDDKPEFIFSSLNIYPTCRDSVVYSGRESIIDDSKIKQLLSESVCDRKEFLPELNAGKSRKPKREYAEQVPLPKTSGKVSREMFQKEYTKHRQNLESLISLEKMIIQSSNRQKLARRKERQNTKAFTKKINDIKV
jgi:hypothetical protein